MVLLMNDCYEPFDMLATTFTRILLNINHVCEYTIARGDVKIAHSRMTKTCWETLVACF